MATYFARKSGNVNAADVWATTPNGTASDVFSSFTNLDILVTNGFIITLNVDTTVAEVRVDTTGGATAGGYFILTNQVTLTANLTPAVTNNTSVVVCDTTGTSATIIGNIVAGSAGTNGNGVRLGSNASLTIIGNITGGSSLGANCFGVSMGSSGTLTVIGNVTAGTVNQNSGIIGGAGIINITGDIFGSSTGSCHGLRFNGTGTANITGTVTGGTAAGSYGVFIDGIGTVNINGTCIGSSVSAAAVNNSVGTLNVIKAKGNGFGNGSVGLIAAVGVAGSQNGSTNVYEIEYGDLGQSPTSGPVFLMPSSGNIALFYRPGLSKKTLIATDSTVNVFPDSSDVRLGVVFASGNSVGTMAVPSPVNVASGVAVDNTIGTAFLDANDLASIWNVPVSGISVSNSIGERLKNCSTVATMGQQLASALSNID